MSLACPTGKNVTVHGMHRFGPKKKWTQNLIAAIVYIANIGQ